MSTCAHRPGALTPEAFPGTCKRLRVRTHLYKSVYVRSEQGERQKSVHEPWQRERARAGLPVCVSKPCLLSS